MILYSLFEKVKQQFNNVNLYNIWSTILWGYNPTRVKLAKYVVFWVYYYCTPYVLFMLLNFYKLWPVPLLVSLTWSIVPVKVWQSIWENGKRKPYSDKAKLCRVLTNLSKFRGEATVVWLRVLKSSYCFILAESQILQLPPPTLIRLYYFG